MRLAALPSCPADAEVELARRAALRDWAAQGACSVEALTEQLNAVGARTRRAIGERQTSGGSDAA